MQAKDAKAFDVLIALGTHPPMSEEAINQRLGITAQDRAGRYAGSGFSITTGTTRAAGVDRPISEDQVAAISGGLMREHVASR